MLKNIMTQLVNAKSIFLHLLWLVFGLLLSSMLLVYWSILTILCLVSLAVIWLLVAMLPKGQVLVLTQEESEELIRRSEAAKFNIRELFRFLKSSKQPLNVVLKMVLEAARQLFTSPFGTKK